jgi:hypothetical protein
LSQRRNAECGNGHTENRGSRRNILMRKTTKRSAVIAGAAVVIIGGGAAAWAAGGWSIDGDGTATANAATISKMGMTAAISGHVYPGVVTTLNATVANANEFPVKLSGNITPTNFTVGGLATVPLNNTCKADLQGTSDLIATSFPGTPVIPARATAEPISLPATIHNFPQSCAGATITATFTFTGTQQNA